MIQSGIYIIRCKKSVKVYIGSSSNIDNRVKDHFFELKKRIHGNKKLQYAYNLHGEENFYFEVLEYVERKENESKSDFKKRLVKDREQHYLDTLVLASEASDRFCRLAYNINRKADSPLGYKHTNSAIKKIIDYNNRIDIVAKHSETASKTIANRSKEIQDRFVYANKGKKITLSIKGHEKLSSNAKKLNARRKQCPHCCGEYDYRNFSKWHGENCRFKNLTFEMIDISNTINKAA